MRALLFLFCFVGLLSAQNPDFLSPPEEIPLYGGYAWEFEISENRGQQIIFCTASGGEGVYWARFPKGQRPKKLRWKAFRATEMGKFPGPFGQIKLEWHEKSEQLFFFNDYVIFRAGLNTEFAQRAIEERILDFKILGDTLISLSYYYTDQFVKRWLIKNDGSLTLIGEDQMPQQWGEFRPEFSVDRKSGRVILWNDTLLISEKPYYSVDSSLGFRTQAINLGDASLDSIYGYPVPAVDAQGIWYFMASQNFGAFNQFDTVNDPPKPRLLFKSEDEGKTWQKEEIRRPWPIKYLTPSDMEVAYDKFGRHRLAGSLLHCSHLGWREIGRIHRPKGVFVYDGASSFLPGRPDIAFHATNWGPAYSTAYGDSLFLLVDGMRASPMTDLEYYPESRALIAASQQKVTLIHAVATPWEYQEHFPLPEKMVDEVQVAYDAQNALLYLGTRKLYRKQLPNGPWQVIFDPKDKIPGGMSPYEDIRDIALNGKKPELIALSLETAHYQNYLIYTSNKGEEWNGVLVPGDAPIIGNLHWSSRPEGEILRVSQEADWTAPADRICSFLFKADGSVERHFDTLVGYNGRAMVIDYASRPNGKGVALGLMREAPYHYKDFTLLYENTLASWDTLHGEWVEDCYGCYSFPRSVVANDRVAWVGVGHWKFLFLLDSPKPRYIGRRPDPLPVGENHEHLFLIGNYLYIGGEYGLYRQEFYNLPPEGHPQEAWTLYPNPTRGQITIQPPALIEVFDAMGKRYYQSEHPEFQINLGHLPSGLFYVKPQVGEAKLLRILK